MTCISFILFKWLGWKKNSSKFLGCYENMHIKSFEKSPHWSIGNGSEFRIKMKTTYSFGLTQTRSRVVPPWTYGAGDLTQHLENVEQCKCREKKKSMIITVFWEDIACNVVFIISHTPNDDMMLRWCVVQRMHIQIHTSTLLKLHPVLLEVKYFVIGQTS